MDKRSSRTGRLDRNVDRRTHVLVEILCQTHISTYLHTVWTTEFALQVETPGVLSQFSKLISNIVIQNMSMMSKVLFALIHPRLLHVHTKENGTLVEEIFLLQIKTFKKITIQFCIMFLEVFKCSIAYLLCYRT